MVVHHCESENHVQKQTNKRGKQVDVLRPVSRYGYIRAVRGGEGVLLLLQLAKM